LWWKKIAPPAGVENLTSPGSGTPTSSGEGFRRHLWLPG
jgi:hypothetical protein